MEQAASGEAAARASQNAAAVPYIAQDTQKVASLVRALEDCAKSRKKHGFSVKKTRFDVASSLSGIVVDSWRFQDWDYKKRDLPTYARGLFTTCARERTPEIAVRGYDKFFNVGEVFETRWENIQSQTQGPYELTLKENGCIIFISGLEDGTLLVCSKHSTGDRSDVEVSHASAGEQALVEQLQRIGRSKQDLARELRRRNVTAVAELCDDTFEEHILAYGPGKAGLYLHGLNLNLPAFVTYPSSAVQQFADDWGFRKVGLITMDDINEVKSFLEKVAETGAHEGRDVEGFVIRCKRFHMPAAVPGQDWFFKYKFEEPYLMYRQWRECTKAIIAGRVPKYKKHAKITEEYLLYARKRLAADPSLGKLYSQNHGIISLRNDFLAFKNIKGSDAAQFENVYGVDGKAEVKGDVILVPIATIGCGKTTIAVALSKLFNFGHVQNDNITGPKRPPRFTRMVLDQLQEHCAVTADRNNAQRHERKQIITDVKMQHPSARLVALNYVHDNIDEIRRITRERVFRRGDNHQTIQAATDRDKVTGIMEGFIHRFEECDSERPPDDGFDAVINLDPTAGSRANLEIVCTELKRLYPNLISSVPSSLEMDGAIQSALEEYRPDLRHTIPNRGSGKKSTQNNTRAPPAQGPRKKLLEYVAIDVSTKDINLLLERTFKSTNAEQARFYKQLQGTRRIQPKFHVTLMHRATAKEHPETWEKYIHLQAEADASGAADGKFGECEVLLERLVFDDRIMAIVVRILDPEGKWECVNKVAHITVGTRDDGVKPKESNDLLARWLQEGSSNSTGVSDIVLDGRVMLRGVVRGVLSR
ncbi:tRNA ligase [Pleurostoma richardsiae]|uniref:tRNA ligase n=1 Tax=Pleurostoma richardsiae TaxID=41990 RepID=A0AA38RD48_9PEZI|nr:tRNA ligase [Pleurostoma richardsiae]